MICRSASTSSASICFFSSAMRSILPSSFTASSSKTFRSVTICHEFAHAHTAQKSVTGQAGTCTPSFSYVDPPPFISTQEGRRYLSTTGWWTFPLTSIIHRKAAAHDDKGEDAYACASTLLSQSTQSTHGYACYRGSSLRRRGSNPRGFARRKAERSTLSACISRRLSYTASLTQTT